MPTAKLQKQENKLFKPIEHAIFENKLLKSMKKTKYKPLQQKICSRKQAESQNARAHASGR